MKHQWSSNDFYLSAVCISSGCKLSHLERQKGDFTNFVFKESPEKCHEIIAAYWADELNLSPKKVIDSINILKTRLHSGIQKSTMQFYSMKDARPIIERYLAKPSNTRLQTIYKHLRRLKSLSLFGDWVLLYEIVHCSAKSDKFYTRSEVVKVFKQTEDPYLRRLRTNSILVAKLTSKDELKRQLTAEQVLGGITL